MNREETANLLTAMAALDRRTIGAADVIAWQGLLTDVDFGDALEAVKRHYAEQTDWMMPAHVRRLVRDIVREREAMARDTGWAPGQAGVPRGEAVPEVAGPVRAEDLPESVMDLVTRLRAILPEGSREKLFSREEAWLRDHKAFLRSQSGEPNPLYRPNPHAAPLADDSGAYSASRGHECLIKDGRCLIPGHPEPRAGRCDLCGAESGDLAKHVADYPDGSCA